MLLCKNCKRKKKPGTIEQMGLTRQDAGMKPMKHVLLVLFKIIPAILFSIPLPAFANSLMSDTK